MKISEYLSGGTLYIKLSGEMDEYTASSSRTECDKLIDKHVLAKRIVINLSEVAFMDSTGIGFLIGRYKKATRLGIPLFVEKPDLAADKILNLSGIYSLIPKAE